MSHQFWVGMYISHTVQGGMWLLTMKQGLKGARVGVARPPKKQPATILGTTDQQHPMRSEKGIL